MNILVSYIVTFLSGTLIGTILLVFLVSLLFLSKKPTTEAMKQSVNDKQSNSNNELSKIGWLLVLKEVNIDNIEVFEPEFERSSLLVSLFNKKPAQPLQNTSTLQFKKSKNLYFCVLKNDSLILYDSSKKEHCLGIIPLSHYSVSLYPNKGSDTEAFKRDRPIKLTVDLTKNKKEASQPSDPKKKLPQSNTGYFIFASSNTEKEDWFIRIMHAQNNATNKKVLYDQEHLEELIEKIKEPSNNKLDWLNALAGRIFLSVYKTELVKEFFVKKIMSKTTKVKTPSFLGNINIRDLDVGKCTPIFSNPKLLDLKKNGEISLELDMLYEGMFKIVIETEANISVSSRLKQYKVDLVLALLLKKIQGKMLVKIKQPPTNRIWVGFYEEPLTVIDIEPIVSDKLIKLNLVLQAIRKKIMDAINEAIVLPNMDDYCFFPSQGTGGIFDYEQIPKKNDLDTPLSTPKNEKPNELNSESYTKDIVKLPGNYKETTQESPSKETEETTLLLK